MTHPMNQKAVVWNLILKVWWVNVYEKANCHRMMTGLQMSMISHGSGIKSPSQLWQVGILDSDQKILSFTAYMPAFQRSQMFLYFWRVRGGENGGWGEICQKHLWVVLTCCRNVECCTYWFAASGELLSTISCYIISCICWSMLVTPLFLSPHNLTPILMSMMQIVFIVEWIYDESDALQGP